MKIIFSHIWIFVVCLLITTNSLAFETTAKQAVLMDYDTGIILFSKNADTPMVPSSMTKLMTLYIAFDYLKKGVITLDDKFLVSEKAWRMEGSRTFLEHNSRVSIDDILMGIIVQSGNDATIALAEGISGTEEAFVKLMNKKATLLGLTQTKFLNATGWPDEGHTMSALDIAKLSRKLIQDFPEHYHYFSEREFTYNTIRQQNRNGLLKKQLGVDGLKTGHTDAGGFGLAASGIRKERRLISVVNGLSDSNEREEETAKLLEYGYRHFTNHTFYKGGEIIEEAPVWQGMKEDVPLIIRQRVTLPVPKLNKNHVSVNIHYYSPLPAPIKQGDRLATLTISIPDIGEFHYPLTAGFDVVESGAVGRFIGRIKSALQ